MPKPDSVTREMCQLGNAIRKYVAHSSVLEEVRNVTGAHGWMLGYLADHADDDIYQRDLEKEFGLSRSTTSKMLALMEAKGLVQREKVLSDDRLKKITLTEKSKQLAAKLRAEHQATEAKLLHGFSQEETQLLADFLQRMFVNLQT